MNPAAALPRASSRQWLDFLESARGASIHHTEEWGRLLALSGWKTRTVCVTRAGEIESGCLLITKKIPGLGRAVAVAYRGVLLAPGAGAAALGPLLEEIRRAAREEGAIFVSLGAQVPRARDNEPAREGLELLDEFRRLGCRSISEHPEWSTFWADLSLADAELLARMSTNARREIRAAERQGVEVVERCGPEDMELFYKMHVELYRSKGLTITPEITFEGGARMLVATGRATIFWALHEGRPLTAALIGLSGVPRFLWGARVMSEDGKPAPAAGHLLHWRIMQTLRERGKTLYDLGGSPAYELAPSHPNYGVWRFKKAIGGVHVDFVEGLRLVISPGFAVLHDRVVPLYRKMFAISPFLRKRGSR